MRAVLVKDEETPEPKEPKAPKVPKEQKDETKAPVVDKSVEVIATEQQITG